VMSIPGVRHSRVTPGLPSGICVRQVAAGQRLGGTSGVQASLRSAVDQQGSQTLLSPRRQITTLLTPAAEFPHPPHTSTTMNVSIR